MAQWSKALAAFAEVRVDSKYPHDGSQSPITPVPGGLKSCFFQWGRGSKHVCSVHTNMQIYTYKIIFFKWWKERTNFKRLSSDLHTHTHKHTNLGLGGCVSLFSPGYLRTLLRTDWLQLHRDPLSAEIKGVHPTPQDRVSLCNPGCSAAHSIDQTGFETWKPLPQVLGSKVCVTKTQWHKSLYSLWVEASLVYITCFGYLRVT